MIGPRRVAVPLLDLAAQHELIREEVRVAIDRVIESQHFILGPEVEGFENATAAYSHCKYGIGVSSGTDALLVSLMAVGVGPGDEVITTPYTFFATAGSIARLGATPVFVDIDPDTFNIDPFLIEDAITPRTKAMIPVHLFGQMADMDRVTDIAEANDLYVIEDAAQAIGAEHRGRRAGSLGHIGCLSFFPSKNLGGAGDAGMVVTNDRDLADRMRVIRNHGFSPKYHSAVVGGNFRLDALQAAILMVKLGHLDTWTADRRSNAALYRKMLDDKGVVDESDDAHSSKSGIVLPVDAGLGRHVYNQFVVRSSGRDALKANLEQLDIGCEVYYPIPLHRQKCFADLGYKEGDFPVSEAAARESLALPIFPELTMEMIEAVVEAIADFYDPAVGSQ